jgi:hypothetical protein
LDVISFDSVRLWVGLMSLGMSKRFRAALAAVAAVVTMTVPQLAQAAEGAPAHAARQAAPGCT